MNYNLPNMVIDGFSLPLELNKGRLSIFANGLFGLGSHGVPSTRVQAPILELLPTTLYKICNRFINFIRFVCNYSTSIIQNTIIFQTYTYQAVI